MRSMTAFSRKTIQNGKINATWEIKSVNHRYLDITFRMPEAARELEIELRNHLRKKVNRGKIDCTLHYKTNVTSINQLKINKQLVDLLANAAQQIATITKQSPQLDMMRMLAWPDILESPEIEFDQIKKDIVTLFQQTTEELIEKRKHEADALQPLMLKRLETMEGYMQQIQNTQGQGVKLQREKLYDQFQQAQINLDPERLEQEMVYLAQKIDISEEIDRLDTHIQETKKVITKGGVIGRRLDFFMQEMNRETNTIAAKSFHTDTTNASIEIKVLIEQLREQIQNFE